MIKNLIKFFLLIKIHIMSLLEYDIQLKGFNNYKKSLEKLLMTIDINTSPNLASSYIELHNDILDCQESLIRLMAEKIDKKNKIEALQNKVKNMTV